MVGIDWIPSGSINQNAQIATSYAVIITMLVGQEINLDHDHFPSQWGSFTLQVYNLSTTSC